MVERPVADEWLELAAAASSALPGVKVDLARAAARLRTRGEAAGGPGQLHAADLLLAHAALDRDPVAVAKVEQLLKRTAAPTLARFAGLQADEVEQLARQRLFVGDGAAGPRLQKYSGRGALGAWLKAVITSLAIDQTRRLEGDRRSSDDELLATASSAAGPETKLLDAQQRQHFNAAFQEALATLSAQDRTVLRMKFVDGVSVEDIGRAFAVHRTTALRWLEKAQAQVLAQTRRVLGQRLGLQGRELDRLLKDERHSIAERLSRLLVR